MTRPFMEEMLGAASIPRSFASNVYNNNGSLALFTDHEVKNPCSEQRYIREIPLNGYDIHAR